MGTPNKYKLYLFILLVILKVLAINNNYQQAQFTINNGYYYYLKDFLYNQTYCLDINKFIDTKSKIYKSCMKCLKKKKSKECKQCTSNKIFKDFIIISREDTLNAIIYNKKSIARIGDGEFELIFGRGIRFQRPDKKLSQRLKNVLQSDEEGLLIGIPDTFNIEILDNFKDLSRRYWIKWLNKNKFNLIKLFEKNKIYYSHLITRFYIDYKDHTGLDKYIKKLKKIWDKKDVLIIEGEKSRLGVGNDLFDNMKSIQRILCPSINAFDIYDKILNAALKVDKNRLILIALGPTATILAYDLYKAGYHAVDVGHVDIEYEWYLRNATNKIMIKNKFVNEIKKGNENIEDIKDKNYYNQIIEKILK